MRPSLGFEDKIILFYLFWILLFYMQESDDITFESYVRIETVISNKWLHALKGDIYEYSSFKIKNILEWNMTISSISYELPSILHFNTYQIILLTQESNFCTFMW